MEPNRPFRWDLLRGDQLGTLLDDADPPRLWFANDLLECGARVLARSKDGDLHFVGRSVDSLYDLLSGCLAQTSWVGRLRPLPWSLRWMPEPLTHEQVTQMRLNLEEDGLAPHQLQRRSRPAVFVDLVFEGGTFEQLFAFLRTWIDEEGAQWDVVRRRRSGRAAGSTTPSPDRDTTSRRAPLWRRPSRCSSSGRTAATSSSGSWPGSRRSPSRG